MITKSWAEAMTDGLSLELFDRQVERTRPNSFRFRHDGTEVSVWILTSNRGRRYKIRMSLWGRYGEEWWEFANNERAAAAFLHYRFVEPNPSKVGEYLRYLSRGTKVLEF